MFLGQLGRLCLIYISSSQVLGERELLRQEVQNELANAADAEMGPKFLHIVVKLADIESVYFNTASGRSLKFDQDTDKRPRSALTAALASSPRKENAPAASNRCACANPSTTLVLHAKSIKTDI